MTGCVALGRVVDNRPFYSTGLSLISIFFGWKLDFLVQGAPRPSSNFNGGGQFGGFGNSGGFGGGGDRGGYGGGGGGGGGFGRGGGFGGSEGY